MITLDVCPSTLEHWRHDWSLIFPLSDQRLMLAWCEYYAVSPSEVMQECEPYGPGQSLDPLPCRISGKISTDRGRSWSGKFTLQDNVGPLNVKHPNLLRLASDPRSILFLYTVRYAELEEIRIFMRRSEDECETWSEPVQISSLPGVHYLMADRILQLPSGRIILPTFQSDSWIPFDSFCYYSDDEGESWHTSRVRMQLPGHGAQEPSVVVLDDGRLLAVLRTSLGTLYRAHSSDAGESWTQPLSTGLSSPASTPLLKRIPTSGDLLLVWNNRYDPNHEDYQQGHGPRDPLSAAISRDDGETWEHLKDVERRAGGASLTPAVTFLGDEALLTYASQAVRHPLYQKYDVRLKIIPIDWFYR